MIRSSIQILKEEPFFERFNFIQAYRSEAVHYFPFKSPLTVIGLLSKRSGSTSENKGSNVLFGIIK